MVTYTNRELADRLNAEYDTIRRWSREYLPPDPKAGARSGHARQYSEIEAFIIWLAGLRFVNQRGMPIAQAQTAIDPIITWLKEKDFFPLTGIWDRIIQPDGPKSWELFIITCPSGAVEVQAKGQIGWEPAKGQIGWEPKKEKEGVYSEIYTMENLSEPLPFSEDVSSTYHVNVFAEVKNFMRTMGIPDVDADDLPIQVPEMTREEFIQRQIKNLEDWLAAEHTPEEHEKHQKQFLESLKELKEKLDSD